MSLYMYNSFYIYHLINAIGSSNYSYDSADVTLIDVFEFSLQTLNITIQFNSSDLGCMPYDRTLVAGKFSIVHVVNLIISLIM